jgi:mannose-6-phosphate isomerase
MPPHRLDPLFVPRVWGRTDLSPWYRGAPAETPIGEVWFQGAGGEADPLLLKMIFTSERLSVQVHPDDAYAARHHSSRGKTEAWFVLDAAPGARIGMGLKRRLPAAEVRQAALDGSIEELLDWRPAVAGQCWLVPARTIHALGPGLTVFEVQQNSNVTYRLYDYGRPRELHLERGLAVAELGPYDMQPRGPHGALAECAYFRMERLEFSGKIDLAAGADRLLLMLGGRASIGGREMIRGEVWVCEEAEAARLEGEAVDLLLAVAL